MNIEQVYATMNEVRKYAPSRRSRQIWEGCIQLLVELRPKEVPVELTEEERYSQVQERMYFR